MYESTLAIPTYRVYEVYDYYCAELIFFAIDAPPSYEQLFGVSQMKRQMQEAKQDSSNRGVFAAKVCEIFCGSSNYSTYVQYISDLLSYSQKIWWGIRFGGLVVYLCNCLIKICQ